MTFGDSFGERSKIYEKLDYKPAPPDYTGKLPWTVQQQIAATNGIQYADRVGKLTDYPTYELHGLYKQYSPISTTPHLTICFLPEFCTFKE